MEYDIYYLERMCKVIGALWDFKNPSTERETLSKYVLWEKVLKKLNSSRKEKIYSYNGSDIQIDLSEKETTEIKKNFNESQSEIILKPIEPYCHYTEFLKLYKHLKKDYNQEVICNLIRANLSPDTDSKNISNFYCAKNIKITLDAFGISQSELDNKIEKGKYTVTKILNKKTRDIQGSTVITITEKINKIIDEKFSTQKGCLLGDDYWDNNIIGGILDGFFDNSDEDAIPTYAFYKQYPLTGDDLYIGRIRYEGRDKYYEYDFDFLAQEFQRLKKSERKMILNTIYELIYVEYQQRLKLLDAKFKKSYSDIYKAPYSSNRILTPIEAKLAAYGEHVLKRLSKENENSDKND